MKSVLCVSATATTIYLILNKFTDLYNLQSNSRRGLPWFVCHWKQKDFDNFEMTFNLKKACIVIVRCIVSM